MSEKLSNDVSKLLKQLKRAEELKAESKGALDALLRRLQEEFGLDSLKAAKIELEKTRKAIAKLEEEVEQLQEQFNEDWKDILEED